MENHVDQVQPGLWQKGRCAGDCFPSQYDCCKTSGYREMLAAGPAAGLGAAAAPPAFVLPADLVMPPPAGFEQTPKAVQAMWCYARDVNEWREQAGAVIEAYNKATAAGTLQSTAQRAAAAVAYKIDPGYRAFINDDKHSLEALSIKPRVCTLLPPTGCSGL